MEAILNICGKVTYVAFAQTVDFILKTFPDYVWWTSQQPWSALICQLSHSEHD